MWFISCHPLNFFLLVNRHHTKSSKALYANIKKYLRLLFFLPPKIILYVVLIYSHISFFINARHIFDVFHSSQAMHSIINSFYIQLTLVLVSVMLMLLRFVVSEVFVCLRWWIEWWVNVKLDTWDYLWKTLRNFCTHIASMKIVWPIFGK